MFKKFLMGALLFVGCTQLQAAAVQPPEAADLVPVHPSEEFIGFVVMHLYAGGVEPDDLVAVINEQFTLLKENMEAYYLANFDLAEAAGLVVGGKISAAAFNNVLSGILDKLIADLHEEIEAVGDQDNKAGLTIAFANGLKAELAGADPYDIVVDYDAEIVPMDMNE